LTAQEVLETAAVAAICAFGDSDIGASRKVTICEINQVSRTQINNRSP
jgi:hypothetical protein